MKFFLRLFLLTLPLLGNSQKWDSGMGIGDTLPDLQIKQVINYSDRTLSIAGMGDKLVILDFWNTRCGPCIAEFPRLFALQKEFKDQVQFVFVSPEKKALVEEFLATKNVLPHAATSVFITDDSILSQYFKPGTLPHDVWIGPNREIVSISKAAQVNARNINRLLAGLKADWPVKRPEVSYDFRKAPALVPNEQASTLQGGFEMHSAVTGYINGVSPGHFKQVDSAAQKQRLNYFNMPLLQLYSIAYSSGTTFSEIKRCRLTVRDSSRFLKRDMTEDNLLFSYEVSAPLTYSRKDMQRKMAGDLDFFFGLNSYLERCKVICWVIKDLNPGQERKAGTSAYQHSFRKEGETDFYYKQADAGLDVLVETLNNDSLLRSVPIVIDETGFKGKIDLELHIEDWEDCFADWVAELHKYGFKLCWEEREMDMMVFNDQF